MMTAFVVIIEIDGLLTREVRGPYRSFKLASADAKAWDGIDGKHASVEPLVPLSTVTNAPSEADFIEALGKRWQ